MKTAGELAREYADETYPSADSNDYSRTTVEWWDACYDGYVAGHSEAMRWRDPKQELPEVGVKVLVKTSNGKYSVTEMYTYKDFSGTTHGAEWRGSYDFRMSVIGWRPIE